MPYTIEKHKNGGYKVINKDTGKVHAKNTSFQKAEAQRRLLEGLEHGTIKKRKR